MRKDKYRIDDHKLMYHVQRVARWMNGESVYPIYVEISPAGACNHRCTFCSVDFMGYQNRYLDTKILKKRLAEMTHLGIKSIMYAGEGEPFLHKDMTEVIVETKRSGIDVSLTTNGVLMVKDILNDIVKNTAWIKVSCNAGTSRSYSKIHKTKEQDFEKVVMNLKDAAKIRIDKGYKSVLGIQILLLPDNVNEIGALAQIAKDIGLDYLVVKPYNRHLANSHEFDIQYSKYRFLENELRKYNSDKFSVIFRINAMRKWDIKKRNYQRCLALPFWSYIDAGGNVWGCSAHMEDDRFLYGNINENSFEEIWMGEKRQRSLKWVESEYDIGTCKLNCRMDEINKYLWDLKHPVEHVNFI